MSIFQSLEVKNCKISPPIACLITVSREIKSKSHFIFNDNPLLTKQADFSPLVHQFLDANTVPFLFISLGISLKKYNQPLLLGFDP
jgi:hypothetical protein